MSTPGDPRHGYAYRLAVALMWIRWEEAGNGTMCHICGHQGATEADHLVTVAEDPNQAHHWTTMRPSHGVNPRAGHPGPCHHPDCLAINNGKPRACNQGRGKGSLADQARPDTYTTKRW
jgi:hypothetical protein